MMEKIIKKEKEKEFIEMYNSDLSCKEISSYFNTDIHTISRTLRRLGIERTRKRKFNFNVNFFKKIDNEEKAYFLGLLYADGCVTKDGFRISLQEQDKDILDKFMLAIEHNGTLKKFIPKVRNWKPIWVMSVYFKALIKDLNNLGITNNKSKDAKYPNIPDNLNRHFIRGYFDGDGCIHIDKKQNARVSVVGTIDFIKTLQNIIEKELNIPNTKLRFHPKTNYIRYYSLSGNKRCSLLKEFLYKNSTIWMNRKKEKFDLIKIKYL